MSDQGLTDEEIRELGYERPSRGWVLREHAEEHRQTGLTKGQWRRFSFVTARGWVALPEYGSATFGLATCLGKMMNREGTFDRVRSMGDAPGRAARYPGADVAEVCRQLDRGGHGPSLSEPAPRHRNPVLRTPTGRLPGL